MHEHIFHSMTRRAADAITRRGALATLGGSALAAAFAWSQLVHAGKNGKQAKKQARKQCRKQVEACRDAFIDLCASEPDCDEEQLEEIFPCCALLSNCNAGESVECFFGVVF